MENKAKILFDEALMKLGEANEELCRPEEDVVTFLVCKNSQIAIENYLKGYLFQNGIDANNFETIDALYKECLKVNSKFENINLSEFGCTSHQLDSSYCNEVAKVSRCFDAADQLDTFLRQEKVIKY
jgi:HEPN domain-containing protein